MDFDVVIGGDREVVARFAQWPQDLRQSLRARIAQMTELMESRVRALAPKRTGRLADEIQSRVYDNETSIRGVVGLGSGLDAAEYGKAAALEYGTGRRGRFKVRPHTRVIRVVFGRLVAPVTVQVAAYTRLSRLDPRMYLHGGLDAVAPDAAAELQTVIDRQGGEL